MENLRTYQENCINELHQLLFDLVAIPAPSHHEEKRAEFCKKWLEEQGAEGVYIDEAKNCIYPINCEGRDDIVVFMAHTDTVFPDLEGFEVKSDGKNFYAPGVGDDTMSLAIMMMVTKYIVINKIQPKCGVLIVANSCEEGLGNLKGSKQIMKDFAGRIKRFYTFDGKYGGVTCKCVGSHRYEVTCETEGGHSYGAFGNGNAIAELSKVIAELYSVAVPRIGDSKTTYNVGLIEGGTSVNTIAQSAKMLYEYRSDDAECLAIMEKVFQSVIDRANARGKGRFTVEVVGVRPCGGNVDKVVHEEMISRVIEICEKYSGIPCKRGKGSTDCNVPMSMGVPAVCPGIYMGGGAHTREEWVEIASLPAGVKICSDIMLDYFEV
ncbi:MAG: M20/M25/M40 family metallo-hydrolase [Clostridia bacterium]|nr:M20/M25/M40 family metallo-hydrolase [Clostridia bacterium]